MRRAADRRRGNRRQRPRRRSRYVAYQLATPAKAGAATVSRLTPADGDPMLAEMARGDHDRCEADTPVRGREAGEVDAGRPVADLDVDHPAGCPVPDRLQRRDRNALHLAVADGPRPLRAGTEDLEPEAPCPVEEDEGGGRVLLDALALESRLNRGPELFLRRRPALEALALGGGLRGSRHGAEKRGGDGQALEMSGGG